MSDRNPEQKATVIRQVADFIERGGPMPISMTLYQSKVTILCNSAGDWAAWVGEFDGHPVDAAYEKGTLDEAVTFVDWSNDAVEIGYQIRAERVA